MPGDESYRIGASTYRDGPPIWDFYYGGLFSVTKLFIGFLLGFLLGLLTEM